MTIPADISQRIVIVGAGIIGVCCALSLQQRGFQVHLIDRDEPGEATSYGNAGVISPWSCVPQCMPGVWKQVPKWLLDPVGPVALQWKQLVPAALWSLKFFANSRLSRLKPISDAMDVLMKDNVGAYKRHLAGTGKEHLVKDSWYVNVFRGRTAPDIGDLAWQLRIEHGAPVELVDAGQLREIEPAISSEYHSAVIIKDQARAVAPGNLCKVLSDKALKQGATFTRSELRSLKVDTGGGFELLTGQGPVTAQKIVICAGIWSAGLLKNLGITLPLIAERGYHLEFMEPGVELAHSIQDVEAKIVVSSMQAGIRSAGTSEFAALDAKPNYRRAEILKPLTRRLLPGLNDSTTQRWMGIRPSLPDNLPVIDEVREFPGLYAAFGHSHFGLGMAPGTGSVYCRADCGRIFGDQAAPLSTRTVRLSQKAVRSLAIRRPLIKPMPPGLTAPDGGEVLSFRH